MQSKRLSTFWLGGPCLLALASLPPQARPQENGNKTDVRWVALTGQQAADQDWIPIFNGHDLEGWEVKLAGHELNDNFGNTFRVEDGLLKVSYDQYAEFGDRFGHLFYEEKLSHYRLRVEYRFVGEQAPGGPDWGFRNSGIMVHSQSAASMLKDQDFPISIEVQMLGGAGSEDRPTANLCTPGTHVERNGKLFTEHCLTSSSKTFHGDQWVTIEVEVHGDTRIVHKVGSDVVLSYEKPQVGGGVVHNFDPAVKRDGTPLKAGYISLQAESHPVEFRKIELLRLPEPANQ